MSQNSQKGSPKPTPSSPQRAGSPAPGVSNGTNFNSSKPAKKGGWWRWVALGLVVCLLGFGGFVYLRVNSFLTSSFSGRNESSLLQATATPRPTAIPRPTATPLLTPYTFDVSAPQPTAMSQVPLHLPTVTPNYDNLDPIIRSIKEGQPITALILGYGGGEHDGAYLTDTILEVTYDPAKNTVLMVNIPRDLYVFVPYGGTKVGFWGKINSAFSYVMQAQNDTGFSPRYSFSANDQNSRVDAAVNLTKDVVEQVTGTPVDYWFTVSFDGFRKFVDAIGGVDVNVQTAFDDYEYPANDDPNVDASVMHIHFNAGPQHMNGEKAIEYARSRHATQDGSDFGRSKRQMNLLTAVKEKAAKPSIMLQVFNLMDALQGNLRTSLSVDEARALLDYYRGEGAASLKNVQFVSELLSTDNFLGAGTSSDGAFILFPLAGQSNYSAIQKWLEQGREFPALRAEGLRVQVQNGTGLNTPLREFSAELEQNGFDPLDPVWATTTQNTVIYDYSNGSGQNTLQSLLDLLPNATVKTAKKPYVQSPDIVVLLGKDYSQPASDGSNSNTGSGTPQVIAGGGYSLPATPQAFNLPSNNTRQAVGTATPKPAR